MQTPNAKIYIGISLVLIIVLILVFIIPFTKQPVTQPTANIPTPTSVNTNPPPSNNNPSPNVSSPTPKIIKAHFTGAADEQLPKQVVDLAAQKKDLLQKTPLSLSTFTIDFNYSEDKFVVTLHDPKDSSQKEFESWRAANYPALGTDQFLLK